jgi:hypothetical protein
LIVDYAPIIAEATKFLFSEASKWLQNLRDKGRLSKNFAPEPSPDESKPKLTATEFNSCSGGPPQLAANVGQRLEETAAYEMRSLVLQIRIHHRNMSDYEESITELGAIAPPGLKRGLEREERDLLKKIERLRKLLEESYGRGIELA